MATDTTTHEPHPPILGDVLNLADAAAFARVDTATVRRWCSDYQEDRSCL